jgi:WD40 repeat protein
MPPVASGLGEAAVLRRRLTRIMREIPANQLSRSLRGVLALVAGVVLPLQPLVVASSSRSAVEFSPLQAESLAQRTVVLSPVVAAHGEQSSPQAPAPARRSVVRPRNAQNRAARGEQTLATALSPDGRFLISATTGYRVTLLDLETQLQTDLSPAKITAVTFRPDAWQFVTAGADGRIVLWDSLTGKPVREIQSLNEPLRTVAVSPDGEAVAVGGRNGLLGLYEIETGSVLLNAARQPAAVNCVRFSPDGKRLAVATGGWMASEQGEVSLWNLDSGAVDGPYPFTTSPGAVAFVSNDELIIGQWNGRASLWNLSTAAPVAWANADKDTVTAAAFSSDNPLLREVEFLPTGLGLELLQQLSPIFSVGNSR